MLKRSVPPGRIGAFPACNACNRHASATRRDWSPDRFVLGAVIPVTSFQPATQSPFRLTLAMRLRAGCRRRRRRAADEPYGRSQFSESDRDHWAYLPVKRPEVPTPKNQAWVRNPIDAFVLSGLDAAGFEPNGPADRLTLLRRVYLDLIGWRPRLPSRTRFWRTLRRTRIRKWWMICWRGPPMASVGGGTGWTWCATRNRTATSATAPSRASGAIATT